MNKQVLIDMCAIKMSNMNSLRRSEPIMTSSYFQGGMKLEAPDRV